MKLEIKPSQFRTLVAQTVASAPGVTRRADSKFWTYVTANMAEAYGQVQEFVQGAWGFQLGSAQVGGHYIESEGRTIKLYKIATTDQVQAQTVEVADITAARAQLEAITAKIGDGRKAEMTQGKKDSGIVAAFRHAHFDAVLV